jgi:hypothetical protein
MLHNLSLRQCVKQTVVVNERETWSFILRERHCLAVSDDKVLRRNLKGRELQGIGGKCIGKFTIYTYTSPNIIRIVK